MKSSRLISLILCCVFTLALAAMAAAQASGSPNPCSAPKCPDGNCTNVPYEPTDCWTTSYGPAAADVVLVSGKLPPTKSTNMLRCTSGPYALCFYSGPNEKTGTASTNNVLPCVVDSGGKTANCSCQYYSSGENYIDINGILNLRAYYQAVAECGASGENCLNITSDKDSCAANPSSCKEATVCKYVREQNARKPLQSLIPGADTISDFSLAMAPGYNMKGVSPCPKGRYAGCMTAPCTFPNGQVPADGIVQCSCPIVEGPFQIGQIQPDGSPYQCHLGLHNVWSAANTVDTSASP